MVEADGRLAGGRVNQIFTTVKNGLLLGDKIVHLGARN
jgi:hypothetical protein